MDAPETGLLEIRLHGRGGQGAVVASKLLATAAFLGGRAVQSFPSFGVERRGAPVAAFVRISRDRIWNRSAAMKPHHVIVLDASLFGAVDPFQGLQEGGTLLVNASRAPEVARSGVVLSWVDAAGIAARHGLGTRTTPIVNTAILGAFARSSGVVTIESVVEAIRHSVGTRTEENIAAAREAYDSMTPAEARS